VYLGTAADNIAIYYRTYDQQIALVGTDGNTHTTSLNADETLAEFCQDVDDELGWNGQPNVGGTIETDLREALA